jgi:hypothetical protein
MRAGYPHQVLLWLPRLIASDVVRQMLLPGVAFRLRLVGDLPDHVVHVVERVDYPPDIMLLQFQASRMTRRVVSIVGQTGQVRVHIIRGVEWVRVPTGRCPLQGIPLEEHDRDVDPVVTELPDAVPEPVQTDLAHLRDIPLGLTVKRGTGSGPYPRVRRALKIEVIEAPQPGEVVVPGLQEIKMLLKGLKSLSPRLGLCLVTLLDRSPEVRPRQVDRPAGVVGEVSRVRRVLPERSAGAVIEAD